MFKIKNVLGVIAISLFGLVSTSFAQLSSVQSINNYQNNQRGVNYNMGTIFLNGNVINNPVNPIVNTNIPTNTVTGTTSSTTTVCIDYLTTYQKIGDMGPEVVKLQAFLNEYNGAKLNLKGYFGKATLQEVKNFQYNYGIYPITGNQFEKTTKMINDLKCGKVLKKDRKVYLGKAFSYQMGAYTPQANIQATKTLSNEQKVAKIIVDKIFNSDGNKKVDNKATSSVKTSTSSSFKETLMKEFENIKENYKSYLVVFLLVFALFWFLKKTATN